jgi:hypothetical protein
MSCLRADVIVVGAGPVGDTELLPKTVRQFTIINRSVQAYAGYSIYTCWKDSIFLTGRRCIVHTGQ